jgi:transcriptional regulator with XRE-family HTH domain
MNFDNFKDRLKESMGSASNRGFAENCGFSEGTLRRYLLGETFPPLDTLGKIAEVSGYNLAWLASGEGVKKRINVDAGYTVLNPVTGEEVYIEPGFHDELQVAVIQAIIELAAPGLDEQTVKNFASLYPETIKSLKEGNNIVPPIEDIKKIARLFGALYDFYDSDNENVELSGAVTGSVTKRVEKIVSKGKVKAEKEFNSLIKQLKTEYT